MEKADRRIKFLYKLQENLSSINFDKYSRLICAEGTPTLKETFLKNFDAEKGRCENSEAHRRCEPSMFNLSESTILFI